MTTNAAEDPFAHLHDEDYAAPYARRRVGADDMICMAGRTTIPLDGDWLFVTDLFDEGLRQKWFADEPLPISQWTRPRDYDFDERATVPVPSCWTVLRPEWAHFEGAGWYTRNFAFEPAAGRERLVLRIGAANYEARVFLNGTFVASHRGGSTPFFVDLTQSLRPGENRLQVQVDNRRRADRVPMHHFDWHNDGGLYREVELVPLPTVFIRDCGIALVPDGTFSRITVDITLSHPVDDVAEVEIPGLCVRARCAIAAGRGTVEIEARPQLWSPGSPHLYHATIRAGEDVVVETVGFREVRRSGREILFNGEPLWLRGVCVHEDDAVLGRASTEEDVRRRFRHARELGCNVLRLAHYPHHERVARIADEEGLMLWEEVPVYWAIDFANPDTYADAENQLLEMIRRDRNRASVILWGVGNENADTDARYAFMSGLASAARRVDPTRLIAAACLINREAFRIEDRLAQHLDVIGLNEYFGWYEPDLTGLERLMANSDPDRPVVISEVGADALAGHRGGERELFTEDCQAAIFRDQIAVIRSVPWIRGFFPWLLYDFRSPRRQTRFQRGWNRKGLIAEDKSTKKSAFAVVADFYRERQ